ncbi:DUF2278 family protein [Kribbella speibonae]|uniref:DUF2278 family protein n=1 Tax=Kribbella speibonae TaxID=1572660 RepID=A0A4R0I7L1_9ACTN|nr:DUF2278 family protein [Kribbella speibonae]
MQYREVRNLNPQLFASTAAKSDGWHLLASTPTAGALDYIRSPLLRGSGGCVSVVYSPFVAWINAILRSPRFGWVDSSADKALDLLEQRLLGCERVYVFGARPCEPAGREWPAGDGSVEGAVGAVEHADREGSVGCHVQVGVAGDLGLLGVDRHRADVRRGDVEPVRDRCADRSRLRPPFGGVGVDGHGRTGRHSGARDDRARWCVGETEAV